jgi:hypothetical protein
MSDLDAHITLGYEIYREHNTLLLVPQWMEESETDLEQRVPAIFTAQIVSFDSINLNKVFQTGVLKYERGPHVVKDYFPDQFCTRIFDLNLPLNQCLTEAVVRAGQIEQAAFDRFASINAKGVSRYYGKAIYRPPRPHDEFGKAVAVLLFDDFYSKSFPLSLGPDSPEFGSPSHEERKKIFDAALQCLRNIHEMGIVKWRMTTENVRLRKNDDETWAVRIFDFHDVYFVDSNTNKFGYMTIAIQDWRDFFQCCIADGWLDAQDQVEYIDYDFKVREDVSGEYLGFAWEEFWHGPR